MNSNVVMRSMQWNDAFAKSPIDCLIVDTKYRNSQTLIMHSAKSHAMVEYLIGCKDKSMIKY